MKNSDASIDDLRVARIISMIRKYSDGEFNVQEEISHTGDALDSILIELNALGKKRATFSQKNIDYQKRVEHLMDTLLKYTLFDFSQQVSISDNMDEVDAIATGLNALSEELQAAKALNQSQLEHLQESNEKIETLLENAPNAVIVMDESGIMQKWNRRAEFIFGWSSQEALCHLMHELIMPEQYKQEHLCGLNRFLHTGQGKVINKTIEISALRKNKEEFPIELSISAVKAQGKFLFIAFISDISSRKRAEKDMKQVNEQLTESVKSLEAFTYSVSHDLRSPLRAIHGYANLFKNEYSTLTEEKRNSFIDSIMSNSKKMGQLIDDLLSLSRLDKATLQKKPVKMNELVNTVINEMHLSEEKKAQIIIHKLPEAFADARLIIQVFVNLISNALKYSSLKEAPVVEVGSIAENNEVIYFVKDNGSGFDMKFYNKLFGVFQRLHSESEFEGNGVGLSIVKQIITKHKGRVWANSELEKGATFYFTLDS